MAQALFRLLPLCLDLEKWVLGMPLETEDADSNSALALPDVSPACFQSQRYGGSSSRCSCSSLGSPMWGLESSLLWGCDTPPACGVQFWSVGPRQAMIPSFLPVSVWLFIFLFSGKRFLLVSGSFSEIVALHGVVILVCSWKEASPGIFILHHLVPPLKPIEFLFTEQEAAWIILKIVSLIGCNCLRPFQW